MAGQADTLGNSGDNWKRRLALFRYASKECDMAHILLLAAIIFEVFATSALQASQQFTRPVPLLLSIGGYMASFYLLSLSLKTFPLGVAYAVWSGLGIVLISSIGAVWFRQSLDLAAISGIGLIIAGVLVINLFSKTATL